MEICSAIVPGVPWLYAACIITMLMSTPVCSVSQSMMTTNINSTMSTLPVTLHDDAFTTMMPVTSMVVDVDEMTTESATTSERQVDGKIPLYLGAFFSLGGAWEGSGLIPAVDLALRHINDRPDLLPDYELRMVWNNTDCEAGVGTRALFDQIFREPQKIMLLGPPCSNDAQVVAETSFYWNLITMSYSAGSPELSNRNKYPYFYRTYMPNTMTNYAKVEVLKLHKWTRVAIIHEISRVFSLTNDHLVTLLKQANITVITSESFAEDPSNQVANIKKQDARIILSDQYDSKARRVFCQAYKEGLTGEGYVWFTPAWYPHLWYLVEDTDCTQDEMRAAVESSFYVGTESSQLSTSTKPTISGLTADTYYEEIMAHHELPEFSEFTFNHLGPFGYDAAWAVALALNRSVGELENMVFTTGAQRRRLEDFNYDDHDMAQLFFDLLNNTEFEGLTGPITFRGADRVGIVLIEQFQLGCSEDDQHQLDSWCLTFVSEARNWTSASERCSFDVADDAVLAPVLDIDFLAEVAPGWNASWRGINSRWYLGFYIGPDGSMNQATLDQLADRLSISSLQEGCIAVDFDQETELVIVDCEEEYPYICAQQTAYYERQIALYDMASGEIFWRANFTWPGDEVPRDSRIVVEINQGINFNLYITMSALATLGIVIAIIFLVFNVKFRNQKFVKLSSPNLNNLIILGSVMIYSWIFVYGLDTNLVDMKVFSIICQFRIWVISLGFTTAFGAMFSKTWRVHRVASFKGKPKRRIVRDTQLYFIIVVILLLDIVLLLAWQILDPMVPRKATLSEMNDPEGISIRFLFYLESCHSVRLTLWLGVTYGYKGLLLVYGTFLAWETRKVTIPALNDSKLIGISVYNVCLLCPIAVGVSFSLSDDRDSLFSVMSVIVLFCTTFTLCVVFVPKILTVHKDPLGEHATGKKNGRERGMTTLDRGSTINAASPPSALASSLPSRSSTTENGDRESKRLKEKIKMLERQLQNQQGHHNTACGISICRLTCGCSCQDGCYHYDDDHDPSEKYSVGKEDEVDVDSSSGAALYIGPGHHGNGSKAPPAITHRDKAILQTNHDAVDDNHQQGIVNGGFVADQEKANSCGGSEYAVDRENSENCRRPSVSTHEDTTGIIADPELPPPSSDDSHLPDSDREATMITSAAMPTLSVSDNNTNGENSEEQEERH